MNIKNLFGDSRTVKKLEKIANEIDNLDAEMQELSDSELKNKTNEFKKRIRGGESLEQIQVEAFAVCREAAVRSLGMKPYKVQLIGGLCLHQGKIAEMKTGEGKTLVAALPAYLNALTGNGVHVVTVNDYLAKRDAEQMGKLYNFLGLSVGCITNDIDGYDRRAQYMADITYGTNNEFGFDYLRDNMSTEKSELIQRELNYAIVDEVDSILIDEARTPLIISGMGDNSSYLYKDADMFVKSLDKDDYIIEEKDKQIALSETGIKKCENRFNIDNFADPENLELNHYVNAALKANYIMTRDIDYIVSDDEILIVDEFTGRIMYGRRFSNGLHQAIEAKEGIKVKAESQTLATITLQNYFRMYNKLSGMTGTAKTEEEEFREIYNLPVLPIPTNKPVIRDDRTDIVFAHQKDKYNAIVEKIIEVHETGQPVLVGTVSIEISELLSKMLKKRGVKHNVLNAKNHEKEAEIIAEAGKFGAITIATNMAGRGTDILLGGNPEFEAKKEMKKLEYTPEQISFATGFTETDNDELKEARKVYRDYLEKFKKARESEQEEVKNLGGLFIIGTERHESRRVDNQLRGRAGRQGDPGTSQFFVSMEDDLARLFGGERSQKIIKDAGLDDEPLDGKMITKILESAQKKVEGKNFGIRKYVLQYDDVMNQQREIIYGQRRDVLEGKDISASVIGMAYEIIDNAVDLMTSESKYPEEWDYEKLFKNLNKLSPKFRQYVNLDNISSRNDIESELYEAANKIYKEKEEEITEDVMRHVERIILLRVVDAHWMEHIDAMDQLKEGIGLRGIGQQDPAQAYSKEGFAMFDNMIKDIRGEVAKFCFNITVTTQVAPVEIKEESQPFIFNGDNEPKKKIGRNDACPCGSGKKYKNCCGLNK